MIKLLIIIAKTGQLRGVAAINIHVNDGVSLDVFHVRILEAQFMTSPLCGADDSCRDGVLQGKGAAHCNHEFPRPQIRRVAQKQHR